MTIPTPESTAAMIEGGRATQFGGERANPQRQHLPGTNAPWSLRNAVRTLLGSNVDLTKPAEIEKFLSDGGRKHVSNAERIAVKQVLRAMESGSDYDRCADSAEGKLVTKYINEDDGPKAAPVIIYNTVGTVDTLVEADKKG